MSIICTVGYEGADIERFISTLKAAGEEATIEAARAAVRAAYLRDQAAGCDPVWCLPPGDYRAHGPVTDHLPPDTEPPPHHTPLALHRWPAPVAWRSPHDGRGPG